MMMYNVKMESKEDQPDSEECLDYNKYCMADNKKVNHKECYITDTKKIEYIKYYIIDDHIYRYEIVFL